MKLIYINLEDSSVMEGQVISLLKYYSKIGKFEETTLLQGFRNAREKSALKKKLHNCNFQVRWFRAWYKYTFFNCLEYFSLAKVLNQLSLDGETIIHVRGEHYSAITQNYLRKKKFDAKLLADLRGVVIEEIKQYYNLNSFSKKNKVLLIKRNYKVLRENTKITVVSEAFKEYLINQFDFKKENICVHPNIAGQQFTFNFNERNKIREKLGFSESSLVAICSSGGGSAWQKDREVISTLVKSKVHVINLSKHKVELPGVINKIVRFELVPGYLAAADIAVLWRDKSIVNQVASPSKFSEFACMGLMVLHNGTVEIASEYIRSNNAGFIVESLAQIAQLNFSSVSINNRRKLSLLGRISFGIEQIGKSYISKYEEILYA